MAQRAAPFQRRRWNVTSIKAAPKRKTSCVAGSENGAVTRPAALALDATASAIPGRRKSRFMITSGNRELDRCELNCNRRLIGRLDAFLTKIGHYVHRVTHLRAGRGLLNSAASDRSVFGYPWSD